MVSVQHDWTRQVPVSNKPHIRPASEAAARRGRINPLALLAVWACVLVIAFVIGRLHHGFLTVPLLLSIALLPIYYVIAVYGRTTNPVPHHAYKRTVARGGAVVTASLAVLMALLDAEVAFAILVQIAAFGVACWIAVEHSPSAGPEHIGPFKDPPKLFAPGWRTTSWRSSHRR